MSLHKEKEKRKRALTEEDAPIRTLKRSFSIIPNRHQASLALDLPKEIPQQATEILPEKITQIPIFSSQTSYPAKNLNRKKSRIKEKEPVVVPAQLVADISSAFILDDSKTLSSIFKNAREEETIDLYSGALTQVFAKGTLPMMGEPQDSSVFKALMGQAKIEIRVARAILVGIDEFLIPKRAAQLIEKKRNGTFWGPPYLKNTQWDLTTYKVLLVFKERFKQFIFVASNEFESKKRGSICTTRPLLG